MADGKLLDRLARAIAPELKGRGFTRRGLTFRRVGDEVLSLIELQPSRRTNGELRFAINYGVAALALLEDRDPASIIWTGCHWRRRVDGAGQERWFHVDAGKDPGELTAVVRTVLAEEVLPAIDAVQSAATLIEIWQSGRGTGIGEGFQLLCLGRLLLAQGRANEIAPVIAELESLRETDFVRHALRESRALCHPARG